MNRLIIKAGLRIARAVVRLGMFNLSVNNAMIRANGKLLAWIGKQILK